MIPLRFHANSRKQGDAGLGAAICYFTGNGHIVCLPISEGQEYDLIVDMGSGLKTVQIKTTRYKAPSGHYIANLRVLGGNRSGAGKVKKLDTSKIDYVFVLDASNAWYLIPTGTLNGTGSVTLNESRLCHQVKPPDSLMDGLDCSMATTDGP